MQGLSLEDKDLPLVDEDLPLVDEGDSRAANMIDTYVRVHGFGAWQYAFTEACNSEDGKPTHGCILIVGDSEVANGTGIDAPFPKHIEFYVYDEESAAKPPTFDVRTHFAVAGYVAATPRKERSYAWRLFSRHELPWEQGPRTVMPEFERWLDSFKVTAQLECWRRFVYGDPHLRVALFMHLAADLVEMAYLDAPSGEPLSPVVPVRCIGSLYRRDLFATFLRERVVVPGQPKALLVIATRIDKELLSVLPRDFEVHTGITAPSDVVEDKRILWCPFIGPGSARCDAIGCVNDAFKLEIQLENGASKALRCTRCDSAVYCSKECQSADWKLRHRAVCVESTQPASPAAPETCCESASTSE